MADAVNTADAVSKDGGSPTIVGDPDRWVLLTKFVSSDKRIAKSSKAYQIDNVGCIVQVTTKEGDSVAEALTFVPGVTLHIDENGGWRLVSMS